MHGIEQRVQVVPISALSSWDRLLQVHTAVLAEVRARPTGFSIDTDEVAVARSPEDAFIVHPVRPIRHASLVPDHGHRRGAVFVALGIIDPARLARLRIQGHADRERRIQEESASHHQRRRFQVEDPRVCVGPPQFIGLFLERIEDVRGIGGPFAPGYFHAQHGVDGRPTPSLLEAVEVGGINLVQRRVFRAAYVSAVAPPFSVGRTVLGRDGGTR